MKKIIMLLALVLSLGLMGCNVQMGETREMPEEKGQALIAISEDFIKKVHEGGFEAAEDMMGTDFKEEVLSSKKEEEKLLKVIRRNGPIDSFADASAVYHKNAGSDEDLILVQIQGLSGEDKAIVFRLTFDEKDKVIGFFAQ